MAAKVDMYTSALCGFCTAAKRLLNSKDIAYEEIDVTFDRATRGKMTERADGKTSVPQIFIDNVGIGGCDDLYALDHNGGLDALINPK
ncbi:MAG: glutaredoxin 3 [Alphaproteobacteria bacterium]|nr:glutaredoxin 3 [Alphaproteobacteria bacterium]